MPFCSECGKPVAATAKFCRNCGAPQLEPALAGTTVPATTPVIPEAPVTVPAPAPEAVPVPEPLQPAPEPEVVPVTLCNSCKQPLDPGEKFCGQCGTRAGGIPLSSAPAGPQNVCASCGTPYTMDTKFCGGCGAPVGVASQTAHSVPPTPAPRLCAACGNPIRPGDKFCSKCLVMVKDSAMTSPAPVPVATSAPISPPGGHLCTACGNPIRPGDKYCSKCLVMVKDAAMTSPVPVAVPSPAPAAPIPPGSRACTACGNPIKPGDKFCSKCLVTVKDAVPAAPAATGYTCASCGTPLSGNEKFCGACGGPAVAAKPVTSPAPAGKTCAKCGAPVSETTKFCGGCGAPVGASFPAAGPVTPSAPAIDEQIVGVIGNAKRMKMLGVSYDSFNIIVTSRRMIFAQMTAPMLNAAIAEAQARAKADGKGFFGIVKDQLAAQFQYAQRYETMNPDAALAETPGNIAIDNALVIAVSLSLKGSGDDETGGYSEFLMRVDSSGGRHEYVIAEDDRFVTTLKTAYGDRVKMPFGYSFHGIRIKFF